MNSKKFFKPLCQYPLRGTNLFLPITSSYYFLYVFLSKTCMYKNIFFFFNTCSRWHKKGFLAQIIDSLNIKVLVSIKNLRSLLKCLIRYVHVLNLDKSVIYKVGHCDFIFCKSNLRFLGLVFLDWITFSSSFV